MSKPLSRSERMAVGIGAMTLFAAIVGAVSVGDRPEGSTGETSHTAAPSSALAVRTPWPPSVGQGASATAVTSPPADATSAAESNNLSDTEAVTPTARLPPVEPTQDDVPPPVSREVPLERPSETPVVRSSSQSPIEVIREWIAASVWPAHLWPKVEAVVMCESRGSTTVVAPAGYVGLMQTAPWLHGPVPPDAVGQLNQGYRIFVAAGHSWSPWPVCGRL